MFEMKNENDLTATKKKNEDFLKELDKDRNEKGCEYAILVSLLEPDSELYNSGIVVIPKFKSATGSLYIDGLDIEIDGSTGTGSIDLNQVKGKYDLSSVMSIVSKRVRP